MRWIATELDDELQGALHQFIEESGCAVSLEEALRAALRNWAECRGYLEMATSSVAAPPAEMDRGGSSVDITHRLPSATALPS